MKQKYNKKIVIYGGSFNPPHIGHASGIETILRLFTCDEIWVMPSANRRDKPNLVDGKHRFNMLKIMLDEFFSDIKIPVKLSRLEIDEPKLSTTFHTKQELEKKYPNMEFWFLIGSDLLLDIQDKWVNGKELYNSTNFVVFQKSGSVLTQNLPKNFVLLNLETVWMGASSTFIRNLLSQNYPPIPYVSLGVANYIKKHHLYV